MSDTEDFDGLDEGEDELDVDDEEGLDDDEEGLDEDEEGLDDDEEGLDDEDGFSPGYEVGDVNTVAAGVDYEAGDVNTVEAARRGAAPEGAPGAQMPVAVLEYLARSLADEPDAVTVRQEPRRGSTVLRLHVAPTDMGRIIGRRGRTAQAIRTLVGAAGARGGVQAVVDIVDD